MARDTAQFSQLGRLQNAYNPHACMYNYDVEQRQISTRKTHITVTSRTYQDCSMQHFKWLKHNLLELVPTGPWGFFLKVPRTGTTQRPNRRKDEMRDKCKILGLMSFLFHFKCLSTWLCSVIALSATGKLPYGNRKCYADDMVSNIVRIEMFMGITFCVSSVNNPFLLKCRLNEKCR